MYDHKIGDPVMVDNPDIKKTIPGIYQGMQGYKAIITSQTDTGDHYTLQVMPEGVKPILVVTNVEQWQIQKRITRDINRLLKLKQPDLK